MPSPEPLSFLASGRPDPSEYQYIVPRTPHSRSGRAEEAVTETELDDDAESYATYRQQQSEPLLASSASSSFPPSGYRSRGDDHEGTGKPSISQWRKQFSGKAILYNTPLIVGTVLAGLILVLIIFSYKQPQAIEALIGEDAKLNAQTTEDQHVASPAPVPTPSYVDTYPKPGHLISYENYTAFPLTGAQYRHECNKMMGGKFMHHSGYWIAPQHGIMDTKHHDDVTDYHLPEGGRTRVCSKTITYQLDGHVGLAADLALMAQVAALAREVRFSQVI